MALIKCPECGKEISDKSSACIHCGYPLDTNTTKQLTHDVSGDDILSLVKKADELRSAKNYAEALPLYEKAAELGHVNSQIWVGNFYDRGLGVDKDYAKAIYWFEKAAQQDNASALNNLGAMYENGKGVEKNGLKAEEYYLRASNAGNSFANRNLGSLYYFGNGVPKNYELAFKYYVKALLQGLDDNVLFNNLGVLYMDGKGTAQDFHRAEQLFIKAIQKGNTSAKNNLIALRKIIGDKKEIIRTTNVLTQTTNKNIQGSEVNNRKFIAIICAVVMAMFVFWVLSNDSSSNDSSSNEKTSYCSSCGRSFSNMDDRKSIAYSNMCENCHKNYEYSQNMVDGIKKHEERYGG